LSFLALAATFVFGGALGRLTQEPKLTEDVLRLMITVALAGLPATISLFFVFADRVVRSEHEMVSLKAKQEETAILKASLEATSAMQKRHAAGLVEMSTWLADGVAKRLQVRNSWATEALKAAKVSPTSDSVFSERLGHFNGEKEFLAQQFSEQLVSRCAEHLKRDRKVFLLIDSGTTLFPLFKMLPIEVAKKFPPSGAPNSRFNGIEVITNNLPGVNALMEAGRASSNRFSELLFPCRVLPGRPLPTYNATVGRHAISFLEGIRDEPLNEDESPGQFKERRIIAIVTANWIRLQNENNTYKPVLLARGRGHKDIKEKMCEMADEIYVVAPLGKIVALEKSTDLNEIFGFRASEDNDEGKAYEEVKLTPEKDRNVRIVSTSRHPDRLLGTLSTVVKTRLNIQNRNDFGSVDELPGHTLYPFEYLPDDSALELIAELPHANTRHEPIRERLFRITGSLHPKRREATRWQSEGWEQQLGM
jgi:hypothetical protein